MGLSLKAYMDSIVSTERLALDAYILAMEKIVRWCVAAKRCSAMKQMFV